MDSGNYSGIRILSVEICGNYFFINSSTADVIALTPVRKVGSGTGANNAE